MNLIRPIRLDDLDALVQLAAEAGAGFTSLPLDAEFLREKIELSLASFDKNVIGAGHERYLFVLEHREAGAGEVIGCCAVEAACGLDEPFYNYHVGTTVHASRKLKVYNRIPTLYLSNDYTATSVLCSLYLKPGHRHGGNGKLLSKCRLLFMANFPERFAAKVIAEMRGVSDANGHSPFWEGLGRHFFSIDYADAERIVGSGNKAFVAELMPPHPIYTVLLSPQARAVIGQVHDDTRPALRLLEGEGFRYQNYIDIFDGGPTLEAPLAQIRSVRESQLHSVHVDDGGLGESRLIANTSLRDFRCALAPMHLDETAARITPELAAALELQPGDQVRTVMP